MNKNLLILIIVFAISIISCKQTATKKIIGVKIYDITENIDSLINEWKTLGINTAFVSDKIAANKEFRQKASSNNIVVFIIEPIFFNPEILLQDSSLYAITNKGNIAKNDWVEFVCPSNTGYHKIIINKLINDVKQLNPDGISIDFIRHFLYWEMVKPNQRADSIEHGCFCNRCISSFTNQTGINIPDTFFCKKEQANFILQNYKTQWAAWKSNLISDFVKEITVTLKNIKPDLKFNLHAVPWRSYDYNGGIKYLAGQDFSTLKNYVDYISPMCYSFMLYRNGNWIHSVVNNIDNCANNKILPSIQVGKEYRVEDITNKEFELYLQNALKIPSQGVIFWSWEHLEKEPTKKNIIKKYCK